MRCYLLKICIFGSIYCTGWTPVELITKAKSHWALCCAILHPQLEQTNKHLVMKWSIYHHGCGGTVSPIESSGLALRKLHWAYVFTLCKISRNRFFPILNTPTNASEQIYTWQWRPQPELQAVSGSASMWQSSSFRYVHHSRLHIPLLSFAQGALNGLKALRAAKHIFISSTLRVRAADSILWSVTKSLDHLAGSKTED